MMRQRLHSQFVLYAITTIYELASYLITTMPASQLHFLANKNAELAGGSQ